MASRQSEMLTSQARAARGPFVPSERRVECGGSIDPNFETRATDPSSSESPLLPTFLPFSASATPPPHRCRTRKLLPVKSCGPVIPLERPVDSDAAQNKSTDLEGRKQPFESGGNIDSPSRSRASDAGPSNPDAARPPQHDILDQGVMVQDCDTTSGKHCSGPLGGLMYKTNPPMRKGGNSRSESGGNIDSGDPNTTRTNPPPNRKRGERKTGKTMTQQA